MTVELPKYIIMDATKLFQFNFQRYLATELTVEYRAYTCLS